MVVLLDEFMMTRLFTSPTTNVYDATWSFTVSEPNFAVVTAPSANFAVVIAPSANFAVVIAPSATDVAAHFKPVEVDESAVNTWSFVPTARRAASVPLNATKSPFVV
jgi:hypothetical protein